jgi:hypothetical protein
MSGKTFLGLSVAGLIAAAVVVAIVGNVGPARRLMFPDVPRIGA